MLFAVFLHKSHIWEITEIRAKMLLANQITGFLKSTTYLEQNDEKA